MSDVHNKIPHEETSSAAGHHLWKVLQEAVTQNKILGFLLALGVLYTLYFAKDMLMPVFIALFLTTLLQPFVYVLGRLRIAAVFGAAITVALLLAILFFAFFWLWAPAGEWLDRAPGVMRQAEYKLYEFKRKVAEVQKTTEKLQEMTDVNADKSKTVVVEGPSLTEQLIGQAGAFGVTTLIVLVLIFLFLAQGGALLDQLVESVGERKKHIQLLQEIRQDIGRYLITISIINFVLGLVTAGLNALLGMPNPLLWGAVAGALNFIPYLGGAVTTAILAAVAFVTFEHWGDILLPPLLFVMINGLEGYIVTPMILGKRFSLNPIVVFLSLIFWGGIWGIAGVFLATPILVTIIVVANKLDALNFLQTPSNHSREGKG